MCDEAGSSICGTLQAAVIATLYCSGLRISELLSLRPHHITERGGSTIVNVESGKGERQGWSVLMPDRGQLARWMQVRASLPGLPDDAPLFCCVSKGVVGRPLTRQAVDRAMKRCAEKAGVTKRVHPHGARHSHSVALYAAGAPQSAIQDQLRHVDPETTRRYLRDLGCIDSQRVLAGLSWG